MMTHNEMIEVIQAHRDGKKIQAKSILIDWHDTVLNQPSWNFDVYDYRIKPEPREWWVNVYPDGDSYWYETKEAADKQTSKYRLECRHVREVLP